MFKHNFENVVKVYWKKFYEYEMFLIELGKFWHKFQINWINRTQVMDEIVGSTLFRTDSGNVKISCGI